MKITVITPCYNCEKYIKYTLESVLLQKGDFELEYIIVDGNSTDGTKKIIEYYIEMLKIKKIEQKCNNITMKFISENDKGMYDALAKGLKIATGDIIAYLNADDLYFNGCLNLVNEIFTLYNQVKWLKGMDIWFNEKGQVIGSNLPFKFDRKLMQEGIYGKKLPFIQQESIFWRRELLEQIDYELFSEYKLAGDYYLWKQFSNNNQLYIIESFLGGFRKRENQLSQNVDKYMKEYDKIKDGITVSSCFKSLFYKLMWYMPSKIKKKFNKEIIYFNNKKWVLK